MRSPLFKGSRDGNPYCEQCGAFSQIGYITKVGKKKLRLCKPCADAIPKVPIEFRPGKPSKKVQL